MSAGGGLVDADRDGTVAGADCDDTDADVRPGARDIPGNGVDEDCAGGDAKRALAGGRLSFEFLAFRNGTTKAARLLVRDLPAGGKAVLHCKGGGCALPQPGGQAQRRRREPPQAAQAPAARGRGARGPPERAGRHDAASSASRCAAGACCPGSARLCLPPGAAKPGRCA